MESDTKFLLLPLSRNDKNSAENACIPIVIDVGDYNIHVDDAVTPPGLLLSVRALVRVRVSVTIITRRGSCGFCPSFVTTIYTRAHRRWWRVSTVQQLVRLDARNCHYRDYTRFHIRLKNHER